ncbi:MAG: acyl-CoA thioesterase [Pseudomonadales bacterium]|nr:acyl-CoA thioesterase [Pseudomonadales bacterium]
MTIAWDFSRPHLLQKSVLPEHMDAMEHTNNVVYLSWMEEVAWDHSQRLGLSMADYERLGCGMVARRHEIDYLTPTYAGEILLLGTWIIEASRLSTRRAYQFVRVADGVTVLRGCTLWVCVDLQSGKVRRMPDIFVQAYIVST